jgi:hypothetical protein
MDLSKRVLSYFVNHTLPRSHSLRATVQMAVEGEMIENAEPATMVAASSTATVGTAAPSCYRVSVLSGSLEVSARLKNADDLELLMRVLEANKVLFADRFNPEISAKTDRPSTEFSRDLSDTSVVVKADRLTTKPSAKANGSARKVLAEVDRSEPEILTLT